MAEGNNIWASDVGEGEEAPASRLEGGGGGSVQKVVRVHGPKTATKWAGPRKIAGKS